MVWSTGLVSSPGIVTGIGREMYTKIRRKLIILNVFVLTFGSQIASSDDVILDSLDPNFFRNMVVNSLKNYDYKSSDEISDSDLCVKQFSSVANNISNKDVFPGKF